MASYLQQVRTSVRKMNATVYGVPQRAGGFCGKCHQGRMVQWVEDLEDFRCTTCLRGRFGNAVGRPSHPVEEE
jgi:hypothetical protein